MPFFLALAKGAIQINRNLRYFEPSLRMCGESIEMAVQYKDGATS